MRMRISIHANHEIGLGELPFVVYLPRKLVHVVSYKMSVESPGRKAVLQCTSDLTSLLKHNLSCSGKLLEKGLITEAVHNYVLTAQGVSAQEKAARLVSCLADRVGASSQVFHELIEALKETDPFCADVVDKLTSLHSTSQLFINSVLSSLLFASSFILYDDVGSFNALRMTTEEEKKQGT